MSAPRVPKCQNQAPANDNEPPAGQIAAKVLIPKNLPITQVEIEVFAALLDDWSGVAANDNEEA